MKKVPVPVQREDKELILTKLSLDPRPEYVLWFYHHMRKLGYRTYPTLHEAYHMRYYWLRKARRLYPNRRYRFAIGEPVYVACHISGFGKRSHKEKIAFLTHDEAKAYIKEQKNRFKDDVYTIEIGYEWAWYRLTPEI